jgi:hypothetical protein
MLPAFALMPFLCGIHPLFKQLVWLTGMPRSGTTWVSQILASHPAVRLKFCPLFSYAFKEACNEHSTAWDWKTLLQAVYQTEDDYLDQTSARRNGLIPDFPLRDSDPAVLGIKSNRFHHLTGSLLQLLPEIRFIGLIRHPAATLYSWISNPLEFPEGADWKTEWRTGACRKGRVGEFWGFEDWLLVTRQFLDYQQQAPDRFFLFQYEAFEQSPLQATSLLFQKIGLSLHPQTTRFLEDSRSQHSEHRRSVYKRPGNADRWKTEFPMEIQQEIEQRTLAAGLGQFLSFSGLEGQ